MASAPHCGRPAAARAGTGQTVGCSWCDTKHSWPAAVHPHRTLQELTAEAHQAAAEGAAFVVITGGEPLHHDLSGLCTALRQASRSEAEGGNRADGGLPAGQAQQTGLPLPMPLHLETSGVDTISGHFDWITLSPKRHRPPTEQLLAACHELKVVVEGEADLAFAEAMAERALALRRQAGSPRGASTATTAAGAEPDTDRQRLPGPPALLLQPTWESAQGQELAIAYVRSHPAWRLSLQGHKWLGVR